MVPKMIWRNDRTIFGRFPMQISETPPLAPQPRKVSRKPLGPPRKENAPEALTAAGVAAWAANIPNFTRATERLAKNHPHAKEMPEINMDGAAQNLAGGLLTQIDRHVPGISYAQTVLCSVWYLASSQTPDTACSWQPLSSYRLDWHSAVRRARKEAGSKALVCSNPRGAAGSAQGLEDHSAVDKEQ